MATTNRDYEYAEAIRAIHVPKEPTVRGGFPLAALALLILSLWVIACSFDYAEALEIEAEEKIAQAERAANLSLPILFDVSVTQSLPSGREATTRYYVKTSAEGK